MLSLESIMNMISINTINIQALEKVHYKSSVIGFRLSKKRLQLEFARDGSLSSLIGIKSVCFIKRVKKNSLEKELHRATECLSTQTNLSKPTKA